MKISIIAGAPSVGKTSVLSKTIPFLLKNNEKIAVVKMDCLKSNDEMIYKNLNIPVITGLSDYLCPDHFLATNLSGIFSWAKSLNTSYLFIETAGLCNRCAPFISKSFNICTIDCTSSIKNPEKLGPMVWEADLLLLTKGDMISQAEREILIMHLKKINNNCKFIKINGLTGAGCQNFAKKLLDTPDIKSLNGDTLKYPMPSAICSYCVGETRIGDEYHQGMVSLMNFNKED
jgi:Ni2+-binding GTPase involved in maturation of urease and hydrogenase